MNTNFSSEHHNLDNDQIAAGNVSDDDQLEDEPLPPEVKRLLDPEEDLTGLAPDEVEQLRDARRAVRAEIQEGLRQLEAGESIRVKASELDAYFESVMERAKAECSRK